MQAWSAAPSPSLRAKRSNPSCSVRGKMDCFVASLLAMTWMVYRYLPSHIRGAIMGFAALYPSYKCRTFSVMPGLVPGIHVLGAAREKDVDGRDEPGHDVDRSIPSRALRSTVVVARMSGAICGTVPGVASLARATILSHDLRATNGSAPSRSAARRAGPRYLPVPDSAQGRAS